MTSEPAPGRACPEPADAWYFPREAADNRTLEAWCASVGPPIVRLTPSAAFPGLEAAGYLMTWTWNVAAGGGDVLRFLVEQADLRCAGMRSSLEPGGSPFVLLVQEAFRRSEDVPEAADPDLIPRAVAEEEHAGGRRDIVEIAEACGLSLVYVAASRNGDATSGGRREDRGVAILSTLPLSDPWFIELPYEAARRVAVGATVRDGSGHVLRLVNVHLTSATPPARTLATGNGSRLRQGLAVADAVEQMEAASPTDGDGGEPAPSTLLAGDFNTWSDSETTLLRLRELFPDSPPSLGRPTRGAFPTDHILFREGPAGSPEALNETYVRLEDPFHSDHHPVRIRVRFRGSA